jgi:hypothetical protein
MQPVEWDGKGVIRFKRNAIVAHLLDLTTLAGICDLNRIVIGVARGQFSNEDQVQLAQLLGYSVSGYGDLDFVPRDVVRRADRRAAALIVREPPRQEDAP